MTSGNLFWPSTFITYVKTNSFIVWKCCPTKKIGTVWRLQFCKRQEFKILRQMEHYAFWEITHLFQSIRCVRTNVRLAQFNRNYFFGYRMRLDRIPAPDVWNLTYQFLETRLRTMIKWRDPLWTNVKLVLHPPHTTHKRKQFQRVVHDLDNVALIPSNVQCFHQGTLLHVFEDNEEVIKMIIKGRSPTFKNPKIQIKPTRRHTVEEKFHTWRMGVCLKSAIWVLPSVLKWRRKQQKKIQVKKESQQNQSRGIRTCFPWLHQKTPGKTKSESQKVPLSSQNVQQTSTVKPILGASSSNHSELNIDKNWSFQKWKSDELMESSTGRHFLWTIILLFRRAHGQIHYWRRWYGL